MGDAVWLRGQGVEVAEHGRLVKAALKERWPAGNCMSLCASEEVSDAEKNGDLNHNERL